MSDRYALRSSKSNQIGLVGPHWAINVPFPGWQFIFYHTHHYVWNTHQLWRRTGQDYVNYWHGEVVTKPIPMPGQLHDMSSRILTSLLPSSPQPLCSKKVDLLALERHPTKRQFPSWTNSLPRIYFTYLVELRNWTSLQFKNYIRAILTQSIDPVIAITSFSFPRISFPLSPPVVRPVGFHSFVLYYGWKFSFRYAILLVELLGLWTCPMLDRLPIGGTSFVALTSLRSNIGWILHNGDDDPRHTCQHYPVNY